MLFETLWWPREEGENIQATKVMNEKKAIMGKMTFQ